VKPKNLLFPLLVTALGGIPVSGSIAMAQPAGGAPPRGPDGWKLPSLSISELEELIGGRARFTTDFQNARLADIAVEMAQITGFKVTTAPTYEDRPLANGEAPVELTYSLKSKDKPFWEALLDWQRDAVKAPKNEGSPKNEGASAPRRRAPSGRNQDLKLFAVRTSGSARRELFLQFGQPLAMGRTLVKWPYVLVGTQLNRTQQATVTETGLQPLPVAGVAFSPKGKELTQEISKEAAKTVAEESSDDQRWMDEMKLDARVYLDPKIDPIDLRCEIEEAIDDRLNDLRSDVKPTVRTYGSSSPLDGTMGGIALDIPLHSQPSMGKKLVKLRGNLRFWVVTRMQHWETKAFTTPINGSIVRDGGGFDVLFKGVTKTPTGWAVGFSAQSEGDHLRNIWERAVSAPQSSFSGRGALGNLDPNNGFLSSRASSSRASNRVDLRSFQASSSGRNVDFGPGPANGLFGSGMNIQLVDDAGKVFARAGREGEVKLGRKDGVAVAEPLAEGSPLPADIDEWRYIETANFNFGNLTMPTETTRLPGQLPVEKGVASITPTRLIVDLPIERREVVLPFKFTNLPVPPSKIKK
jgi:hypothetical protein